MLRRVSDDEPRPIREINPEVPEWLEAIVERLHAKDPAGRFPSASELADLLSRCLAHVQQPLTDLLPSGLVPAKAKSRPATGIAAVGSRRLVRSSARGPGARVRLQRGQSRDRPAEAGPPAGRGGPRRGRRRTGSGRPGVADETDHPFRAAWERARTIEADLHRPADPPDDDRVSAIARDLADRAESPGARARPRPQRGPRCAAPFPLSRPR